MLKRMIYLLLACVMVFTLAVPAAFAAEPVTNVTLENKYSNGNEYAVIEGRAKSGTVVWTKTTTAQPATELSRYGSIGVWNDVYYFNDSGVVTALDKNTGAVLWRNADFGGASIHSYIDENGSVYACGWYGPDFFAVDKNGKTLKKITDFNELYFWPGSIEKVSDHVLCITLEGGMDGQEHHIHYYVDTADFSFSPALNELDPDVSAYTCTAQEKKELEKFLSDFQWYGDPSDVYSGAAPGALLDNLINNPLPIDYSVYPVEQPDRSWDQRRDPKGKWNNYWKFSEASVDWILTYVFSLTKDQIANLKADLDAGKRSSAYRYNGSYYSVPYGVGGGYDAKILSMTYDGTYYRAAYHVDDIYDSDHGIQYAVLSKTEYNGKTYWSLRYNGPTEPAANMPFLDIPARAYYVDPVVWAVNGKITSGTSELTFGPDQSCTRAQAVTFLWRAAGSPRLSSATGFSDVADSAYYADAVKWAVKNGVTSGVGQGRFDPDGVCSRAQIVTFLYRAAGSPAASGGSDFSDVSPRDYYASAVQWAVKNGVTSGTGNGKFTPNAPCTRGQIVTFLYRWYA